MCIFTAGYSKINAASRAITSMLKKTVPDEKVGDLPHSTMKKSLLDAAKK